MTEAKPNSFDPTTPILIVDDNTQYAQVLRRMLHFAFGFSDITSVDNIAEGFSLMSSQPERFKLIFVDFFFPGGDTGAGLLQQLTSGELLQGKVAFLITSDPSVENVSKATSAGALGVVAKPFDREELKRQLEKARRSLFADSVDYF